MIDDWIYNNSLDSDRIKLKPKLSNSCDLPWWDASVFIIDLSSSTGGFLMTKNQTSPLLTTFILKWSFRNMLTTMGWLLAFCLVILMLRYSRSSDFLFFPATVKLGVYLLLIRVWTDNSILQSPSWDDKIIAKPIHMFFYFTAINVKSLNQFLKGKISQLLLPTKNGKLIYL